MNVEPIVWCSIADTPASADVRCSSFRSGVSGHCSAAALVCRPTRVEKHFLLPSSRSKHNVGMCVEAGLG